MHCLSREETIRDAGLKFTENAQSKHFTSHNTKLLIIPSGKT